MYVYRYIKIKWIYNSNIKQKTLQEKVEFYILSLETLEVTLPYPELVVYDY